MKLGTLYTGIGGVEMGLERHGWVPTFQAENNPFRQRILRERFPDADLYANVEECRPERGSVELVYMELPDRAIARWWEPAAGVLSQVAPEWAVIEFSPTASMTPIIKTLALWNWGIRFFTVTATVHTPSLPTEQHDVRTRAILIASRVQAQCDDTLKMASSRVELSAQCGEFTSQPGTTEMEEESRALPPGWTCTCHCPGFCGCDYEARRKAVRDATSPVISDLVGHLIAGTNTEV